MWKIKIRPVDTLYSKYVRRNGVCEICGRSDIKLEAAHYFSRGKEATRFDDRNVHCICFTCHRESHEGKPVYKNFMISEYGQDGLDKLEYDSNQYCKKDDIMTMIVIKEKIRR